MYDHIDGSEHRSESHSMRSHHSPVDMSNPREVSSVFSQQFQKQSQGQENQDYLSFGNDIYGSDHHGGHHRSHRGHHSSSDIGRENSGQSLDSSVTKTEVQQLENLLQELETILLDVENNLNAQSHQSRSSDNSPSDSNSAPSTSTSTPSDSNSAPNDANTSQSDSTATTTSSSNSDSNISQNSSTQAVTNSSATPIQNQPASPASSNNSAPQTTTPSPDLQTILNQNDPTHATVYLEGDSPAKNSFNASKTETVPSSAHAISGWGIIGNEAGAAVDRSATVDVRNMQTYVPVKGGDWHLVENQNDPQSSLASISETTDFKNLKQMDVPNQNGVGTISAPVAAGMMDHFGVNKNWTPGIFPEGTIDGVFERADIKANENNSGLVAKLGGEYWSNPGQADNTIVGIPGTSNFIPLTDQYQTMYFTNMSPEALAASPPPGISDSQAQSAAALSQKLIIPFPTDSQWAQINGQSNIPKGSLVVPIYSGDNYKPDSFDSFGPNLKSEIIQAEQKGLAPIGYVGTANGTKPLAQVEKEIDAWYANAPVEGIYLGASGKSDGSGYATDPASEAYYSQLADYIHAKNGMAVLNGKAGGYGPINADYLNKFDVQTVGEAGESALGQVNGLSASLQNVPSDKTAIFVSDVGQANLSQDLAVTKANHIGYVWLTNQNYGSSPDYLQEEINGLST